MDSNVSPLIAMFQYSPLPDAATYIRLLQVIDDEHSEDIKVRCKMTTWPMDNAPSYLAISYTWGDPNSCSSIVVNDQAFGVRTNCEFVLKQAYWYEKASYYWVDAICIDQENIDEKGMQVSRMGSIYKQASHVLACVGDHADDSEFLANKLKKRAFTKRLYPRYEAMRISLRFTLGQRFSTSVRFLRAVVRFLERPYFTRLWILQELRNAQGATFLCGSTAIPRSVIYDMSESMKNHATLDINLGEFAPAVSDFLKKLLVLRRLWPVQEVQWRDFNNSAHPKGLGDVARRAQLVVGVEGDLNTLFQTAEKLECQEKKDKIFGLISLIDWGISSPLLSDYRQTEFEVTVSFFKALLANYYHGRMEPNWSMLWQCAAVVRLLGLRKDSTGVPSVLVPRHNQSGRYFSGEGERTNFKCTHAKHSQTTGWRVSGSDLIKRESGFSTWSPQECDDWKVYLPFWVKDGDWIVAAVNRTGSIGFVLVREHIDGFGGSIIGHAVAGPIGAVFNLVPVCFGIKWDPEDLVVYSIMEAEINDPEPRHTKFSKPWVEALNTAVCKRSTPGSSYAFRCDGVSCGYHIEKGHQISNRAGLHII